MQLTLLALASAALQPEDIGQLVIKRHHLVVVKVFLLLVIIVVALVEFISNAILLQRLEQLVLKVLVDIHIVRVGIEVVAVVLGVGLCLVDCRGLLALARAIGERLRAVCRCFGVCHLGILVNFLGLDLRSDMLRACKSFVNHDKGFNRPAAGLTSNSSSMACSPNSSEKPVKTTCEIPLTNADGR